MSCFVSFGLVVHRIPPSSWCSVAKHGYVSALAPLCIPPTPPGCSVFCWINFPSGKFTSRVPWNAFSVPSPLFLCSETPLVLGRPCERSSHEPFRVCLCAALFCMMSSNVRFQVFAALNVPAVSGMFYFSLLLVPKLVDVPFVSVSSLKLSQVTAKLGFSGHCVAFLWIVGNSSDLFLSFSKQSLFGRHYSSDFCSDSSPPRSFSGCIYAQVLGWFPSADHSASMGSASS